MCRHVCGISRDGGGESHAYTERESERERTDDIVDAGTEDRSSTSPTPSTDKSPSREGSIVLVKDHPKKNHPYFLRKYLEKTHTGTFFCLQLHCFIVRTLKVPPQQPLLGPADYFAYVPL